jgi:hypothetical protein
MTVPGCIPNQVSWKKTTKKILIQMKDERIQRVKH